VGLTLIVGAGFAGLAAAVRLCEAGRRVLVLEARPRLGGRATALLDRETNLPVDNGQHVMFGCYRETLALLRTVGAEDRVWRQQTLDVPFVDARGRRTRLRCPDLPAPLHLLGGLVGWTAIGWKDRWAAARLWRRVQGSGFRVQGERGPTVREWLAELRQTRRLSEFLWEPLAVAALNEAPEEASAEAFAAVLRLMFSDGASNAAVVMPAVPLDQMYAEPARAFIDGRGGGVRRNALAKIVVKNGRVDGARVGEEVIPAETVVCTVPWNSFANAFDGGVPPEIGQVAEVAASLGSRPIVTVNLWYDRPVLDEPFVGFPGGTIQWAFDKGGSTGCHLSLTVSGASTLVDLSNDAIIAIAVADLQERLPRARAAALRRGTVVRERHATFSTLHQGLKRPGVATDVQGLFLAGDWIDTGLPGTIEGAVRSGNLAAASVLGARQP
jgi:zeta-carotene desaturase